jgi:hypothetical protein
MAQTELLRFAPYTRSKGPRSAACPDQAYITASEAMEIVTVTITYLDGLR